MAKGVKTAQEWYKFDKTAKNFPNLWSPTVAFLQSDINVRH